MDREKTNMIKMDIDKEANKSCLGTMLLLPFGRAPLGLGMDCVDFDTGLLSSRIGDQETVVSAGSGDNFHES